MPPELRDRFAFQEGDLTLYRAGLPSITNPTGFLANFTRDGIESAAVLFEDPEMLRDQLRYSVLLQATQKDPYRGAESGKPHHEAPGVVLRGLSTQYNACDTAAWLIHGFDKYLELTRGDTSLIDEHRRAIFLAADYIVSHLDGDGLFQESPAFSGADRFALKVTYWKDSQLPFRKEGEPVYPVAYFLAQAQNLDGIRRASSILHSSELRNISEKMSSALQRLFNPTTGIFDLAHDKEGTINVVNSDLLTALYFLDPDDIPRAQLQSILERVGVIATPIGFRTMDPQVAETMEDVYHAATVWPSEQALINDGARKFRLKYESKREDNMLEQLSYVERVSASVSQAITNTDTEIFTISNGQFIRGGCDPQLWTVGAKKHFQRINYAAAIA